MYTRHPKRCKIITTNRDKLIKWAIWKSTDNVIKEFFSDDGPDKSPLKTCIEALRNTTKRSHGLRPVDATFLKQIGHLKGLSVVTHLLVSPHLLYIPTMLNISTVGQALRSKPDLGKQLQCKKILYLVHVSGKWSFLF